MAATEVNVQMQQRRDTAAGWTSADPTLLNGEIGYETDTGYLKIGDGLTNWSELAYVTTTAKAANGTAAAPSIAFASDSDTGIYRAAANELGFATAGSERVRILSGGGITFNGDTNANNALDDYEEGTFTPTLSGATAYSTQSGHYTKVGRMVYFSLRLKASAATATSNALLISGLPFDATSTSNNYGIAIRAFGIFIDTSAIEKLNMRINPGENDIRLSDGGTQINQNNSNVTLTADFILNGFYTAA